MTERAARRLLRRQGMPREEIRVVLGPVIARHLLELHRERLEEWIAEQRELVDAVERAVQASQFTTKLVRIPSW